MAKILGFVVDDISSTLSTQRAIFFRCMMGNLIELIAGVCRSEIRGSISDRDPCRFCPSPAVNWTY
jgi:hypothetical protein